MFLIKRLGYFTVSLEQGSNHCGLAQTHGMNTFNYEVEIAVDDAYLDSRGFILDNMMIHGYFQSLKSISTSCELNAKTAAVHFWNELIDNQFAPGTPKKRSKQIVKIWVRIWGLSNPNLSCIDYLYDRSTDKPLSVFASLNTTDGYKASHYAKYDEPEEDYFRDLKDTPTKKMTKKLKIVTKTGEHK